jgi:hypothetical protein
MFYYRILVPEEAVLTSKARLVGLLQNNQVYYDEGSLTVPYFLIIQDSERLELDF